MTDVSDVKRKYWAAAYENADFICIETYSGFRSARCDMRGAQNFLLPSSPDELLGNALQDALSRSRFVLPEPREGFIYPPGVEFDSDLYNYEKSNARYKQWIADLMQRYGYKTKRALFKNMKHCTVEVVDATMTIQPWHHEKLEAWSGSGISNEDYVVILANSASAEIGAALRSAFSRCT